MKSKILWVLFVLLGSFGVVYYCQYPKPESISDVESFKKQIVHTNADYSVYGREYENRAEYRAAYGVCNEKMTRNVVIY
ncbi:MAG: hypothetical protein IJ793_04430 [Opitutales bacterium]|nr:hypothetical protein [Opitutales bacterium]